MASDDERRTAKAIHLSEKDGRWIYEWNTGDVGKLTIPEGFSFDPRRSQPIFRTAR